MSRLDQIRYRLDTYDCGPTAEREFIENVVDDMRWLVGQLDGTAIVEDENEALEERSESLEHETEELRELAWTFAIRAKQLKDRVGGLHKGKAPWFEAHEPGDAAE